MEPSYEPYSMDYSWQPATKEEYESFMNFNKTSKSNKKHNLTIHKSAIQQKKKEEKQSKNTKKKKKNKNNKKKQQINEQNQYQNYNYKQKQYNQTQQTQQQTQYNNNNYPSYPQYQPYDYPRQYPSHESYYEPYYMHRYPNERYYPPRYDYNRHMSHVRYGPYPPPPPNYFNMGVNTLPPPPRVNNKDRDDALAQMLLAWYWAGYYAGQTAKEMETKRVFSLVFLTSSLPNDCNGRTVCPNDGFCDPNTEKCVSANTTVLCGKYGVWLDCGDNGMITGECGSGKDDDCSGSSSLCQSDTWEGAVCNYPDAEPSSGFNETSWYCGTYGQDLSCFDIGGSVMTGVCGSGKNEDCTGNCKGYHAIRCAKSNYFNVDWNHCKWYEGGYGEWIYCPQDEIATGHCGSGKHDDCGRKTWHKLQCCPMVY